MILDQNNKHVLKKIISILEDTMELSMDGDKRQVYVNFIADVETEDGELIQNAKIHVDFAGDVILDEYNPIKWSMVTNQEYIFDSKKNELIKIRG